VFAVGEIYGKDSIGNRDPQAYNLATWSRGSWTLQRLFYQGGLATIRSVYAVDATDV
jgi:hypothetical protein